MNITYNNITMPFYSNIKELIAKSPYREFAEQNVSLDDTGLPKTVVISLSGGADSAAALYISCMYYPNIEYYPLTCRDVNAPKDADAAVEIVDFIKKQFPNAKLNDIYIDEFNDRDESTYPRAQKLIDENEEYSKLNLMQMSKTMQLDDINEKFMKQFTGPIRLDGMTSNPPKEVRLNFSNEMVKRFPTHPFNDFLLKRVTGEERRDYYADKPALTYNVYQPFINVDKRFVADIYKKHNLMDSMYKMTRSCTGGPNVTDNFTKWCRQCFWCYEKRWAFDLEW